MSSFSQKTLVLLVACIFVFTLSYGQSTGVKINPEKQKFNWKFVSGKIVDEDGRPLNQAIIHIFHHPPGFGAVTKRDGNFSMVVPEDSTICVNYVGFKTVNIKPVYDKEMIIRLQTDTIRLESLEIFPPNYQANTSPLIGNLNKRNDFDQTEKDAKRIVTKKQSLSDDNAEVRFIERNAPIDLNKALIVKNDTICPDLMLEDIDPTSISSIRLLDNEKAIMKYGVIAENGVIEISTEMEIYMIVEEMPEFPGGVANLNKVLKSNIVYPQISLRREIAGAVLASFVVDESGFATNVKIEKSTDTSFNDIVLQAIKNLPKWKSGRQRGMPVKVTFELPVVFKIPNGYQDGSAEKLKLKQK